MKWAAAAGCNKNKQEQLKQQLDYLTGIKQYHHTFEATFKSQYQAISEIVQSEDSQKS